MKFIKNIFFFISHIGIGFMVLILSIGILSWLFGLLKENFIPKPLLEKSAVRNFVFVVIMSLSALFSGMSIGYLYGKGGAKISLSVCLLFLPFFIFLYLLASFADPYGHKQIGRAFLYTIIFIPVAFPLGGWLGERLYSRVHRED